MLRTLASVPDSELAPLQGDLSNAFVITCLADIAAPETMTAPEVREKLSKLLGAQLQHSFFLNVLIDRLEYAGDDLKYSPWVVGFLAGISRNVASAVMWAYSLVRWTRENGPVTSKELSVWFPTGFPTDEAMHKLWDEQKVYPRIQSIFGKDFESDNQLDSPEVWKDKENADV